MLWQIFIFWTAPVCFCSTVVARVPRGCTGDVQLRYIPFSKAHTSPSKWCSLSSKTLLCLNRMSWYTYERRTNKMHYFFFSIMIEFNSITFYSLCSEQSNIHLREDFYVQLYCIISCIYIFRCQVMFDICSNTIKLHVQVFPKMNIWLFGTCRRKYNWIKSLLSKVCISLILLT